MPRLDTQNCMKGTKFTNLIHPGNPWHKSAPATHYGTKNNKSVLQFSYISTSGIGASRRANGFIGM